MEKKNKKSITLSLPWYFTSVLMVLAMVVFYHKGQGHLRNEATQAAMMPGFYLNGDKAPPLPDGVVSMLGDRPVFSGPQLTGEELTNFLASYRIDHVIDLASEAKAEKILPNDIERFIVEKTGAKYWSFNIEGAGSQLNNKNLTIIDSLIDTGVPVFVHCLHGIHRAGVAKGRAYARDGRNWPEIIALLRWEKVIDNPIYDRYSYNVRSAVVRSHVSQNRLK